MKKSFIFIHLVLIFWIIDLGVSGFYTYLETSVEMDDFLYSPGTISQPLEQKNFQDLAHYQIVSQRDLFKTEIPEPPPPPEPPKPEEDIDELEVTDLKLQLMGTITGVGTEPYAVIKKQSDPTQMLYVEGDILDTAVIKTILREKVVLVVNGKNQVLLMEKQDSAKNKKTAAVLPPPPDASAQKAEPEGAEGFVDTVSLKWADIDALKANADELRKQIRVRPHFSNNQMDGYRVYGIKKGSAFERVGLRNGDILSAVNQKEIRTMQDAMGIYGELNALEGKSAMELGIKRNGKAGTIRYSIE